MKGEKKTVEMVIQMTQRKSPSERRKKIAIIKRDGDDKETDREKEEASLFQDD